MKVFAVTITEASNGIQFNVNPNMDITFSPTVLTIKIDQSRPIYVNHKLGKSAVERINKLGSVTIGFKSARKFGEELARVSSYAEKLVDANREAILRKALEEQDNLASDLKDMFK